MISVQKVRLAAMITALFFINVAHANPNSPQSNHTTITISPLHLLLPVLEVTGEFKLSEKMSAAAIAGIGTTTVEVSSISGTNQESYQTIELGAQYRYYLTGNFNGGIQLGFELLYVTVDRDEDDDVSATGEGFAMGPFIGYKYVSSSGFTFDSQLGIQNVVGGAEASSGSASAETEDSAIVPLLNLNIGWSF